MVFVLMFFLLCNTLANSLTFFPRCHTCNDSCLTAALLCVCCVQTQKRDRVLACMKMPRSNTHCTPVPMTRVLLLFHDK